MKSEIISKIKDFWAKYEYKIVLLVGFCLISAISYEFGVLQGQKWTAKPMIIEKPVSNQEGSQSGSNEHQDASSDVPTAKSTSTPASSSCAFVGSKNSDKFYTPTCQWAKRIKPENLVCYKSEQEALAKRKSKSDCK